MPFGIGFRIPGCGHDYAEGSSLIPLGAELTKMVFKGCKTDEGVLRIRSIQLNLTLPTELFDLLLRYYW